LLFVFLLSFSIFSLPWASQLLLFLLIWSIPPLFF
jgi:hypothetical protein